MPLSVKLKDNRGRNVVTAKTDKRGQIKARRRLSEAFRAFGAAIARGPGERAIHMEPCPLCGRPHVADVSREIRRAVERARLRHDGMKED
jgi:hypothetical protein